LKSSAGAGTKYNVSTQFAVDASTQLPGTGGRNRHLRAAMTRLMTTPTPPRPYVSAVRDAAASEKRQRVLEAAAGLLRLDANVASFSLEAVARASGVTRLTVYNQFGSRRGLLEAVFDTIAERGGLPELLKAAASPDPLQALDTIIEIFTNFWSGDPAVGRLHDAMASDPEFAHALTQRNERRRKLLDAVARRLLGDAVSSRERRDVVDVMYACTSHAMFRMLDVNRSPKAIGALVKQMCADALAHRVGLRGRLPGDGGRPARPG
jgi:AcrR family transcriptional regulator